MGVVFEVGDRVLLPDGSKGTLRRLPVDGAADGSQMSKAGVSTDAGGSWAIPLHLLTKVNKG